MKRILAYLIIVLTLPFPVFAHEGHGAGTGHELGHYLLSPAHAIPVAVAVAMTAGILLFRQFQARNRPDGFRQEGGAEKK